MIGVGGVCFDKVVPENPSGKMTLVIKKRVLGKGNHTCEDSKKWKRAWSILGTQRKASWLGVTLMLSILLLPTPGFDIQSADRSNMQSCCCLVTQSCLTLCNPMNCSRPGFSVLVFPRQDPGVGCHLPSPGDLPHPGTEPKSPAVQADSLLLSHWGSP